jgi:Cdc6-like AAA superfamily ATPase
MCGMNTELPPNIMSPAESEDLAAKAGTVFRPRTPINTRELFAGRWEQLMTISDSVAQTGLHIVIFGERGVGKTSLANVIDPLLHVMEESAAGDNPSPRLVVKVNTHIGDSFAEIWQRAFDEVYWHENKPTIGFGADTTRKRVSLRSALSVSDSPSIDEVRRTLAILKRSVFIFDEFDRGPQSLGKSFTDLIKALSDYAVDTTIVIVGVSDTVDNLIRDHASIRRSMVEILLPRMTEQELKDILDKASNALGVVFSGEAESLIVHMSQGLPHYTHLIGLHSVREAAKRLSRRIEASDVRTSFAKAVQQAVQSIQDKYLQSTRSAYKNALYGKVLLACASAASTAKDALGYFHPSDVVRPISIVLKRPSVEIATFQKHINEFCEDDRGPVLERSGSPRAYRYRFRDPLLPPFIFMNSLSGGVIDARELVTLTESD